jgi:hypothetical protein
MRIVLPLRLVPPGNTPWPPDEVPELLAVLLAVLLAALLLEQPTMAISARMQIAAPDA